MKSHFERIDIKEWIDLLGSANSVEKQRKVWLRVKEILSVPSRQRIAVNIYKINKGTKEGDNVIIPGKVLSVGHMEHKVNIAALEYSASAAEKLAKAGCKIMDLRSMMDQKRISIIR